ncbi:MAG TPA: VWA domain-containing protein [Bryobacteraceae bacterium]|jgi:VWFA-related protein|nr:VWA domain-containing protein [Bryobacteraceae bacterium]
MRHLFTKRLSILVIGVVSTIYGVLSAGQAGAKPGAPGDKMYTITDNVNMVLLFASVRNPGDGYVNGLKQSDFHVFDDGKPQTITEFGGVDAPVSVGLVLDDSGSMRSKRPEVVLAGLAFAKESNSRDEFFVVNFNNYVVNGLGPNLPFTDDLQKLRAALYFGTPMGQTALYDAIAHALTHLEQSSHKDRTLIVVSDGGDNVSKTTLPEVLDLIQASRATVYTVGLYDEYDTDRNPGVLKRFSKISGGEFFQPSSMNDIIPIFQKIGKDIRSRYTIGYVPPALVNSSKPVVRTVKVTAVNSGGKRLIVRTRTTYTNMPFREVLHEEREPSAQNQTNAASNSLPNR